MLQFGLSVGVILFGLFLILFSRGNQKGIVRSIGFVGLIGGSLLMGWACLYTVDEGEALVVTMFKKIMRTVTTPGPHLKFPWEETFSFPSRKQTFTQTISSKSSDGADVELDVTAYIKVDKDHLKNVYINIAKKYSSMISNIIIPNLREVIRASTSKFSIDEIYQERSKLILKLNEDARAELLHNHVIVDGIDLRDVRFPEKIEMAIQSKLEKQEASKAMVFEKEIAEKEAEIKEIEARGIAKAQSIINSTLTSKYLQHEAIQVYKKLAVSTNKTFVVMPTDGKSTGMPMILNTQ